MNSKIALEMNVSASIYNVENNSDYPGFDVIGA
jgi:hypothetical protein